MPLRLSATAVVLALAVLGGCASGPPAPAAVQAPQAAAHATRAMADFDALYIAALAATTAAAQDAQQAGRAAGSMRLLQSRWPQLRERLLSAWSPPAPAAWSAAVEDAGGRIAAADRASAGGDWHAAHEELEEVRIALMQARRALGMDYFVDRLTAFHGPMETLALAGTQWKPGQVDAARRAELQRALAECRALWEGIERFPLDAAAYGLGPAQVQQLQSGMAAERLALAALEAALRGGDDATLLKAAAVKPPFARAFTAFVRPGAG